MVSILPSARSPWDAISAQIGQGLSQTLPQAAMQRSQRENLQNSLAQIRQLANNPNSNPMDITLAAMEAGAGIPGSERYLGQIIPMLQQMAKAKASENAPLPIQGRDRSQIEPIPQSQQMPNFLGQNKQNTQEGFFPNVQGPGMGPGQAPQAATSGMKEKVLSPKEEQMEGRKYAAGQRKIGNNITDQEGVEYVQKQNDRNKTYNQLVDQEREERVGSQREYGNIAEEYLQANFPEASRELKTIFQKEGEQLSKQGMSEADINRTLEGKARNIKNSIVNVEKDISAPRIYNKIWNAFNGEYKNFDQAAQDVRKHIQPLIDMGLYDTARKLLQKKGYGLEEREAIIHPLSDQSRSTMNQVPNIGGLKTEANKGRGSILFNSLYDENEKRNLSDALMKMKENEPNFSLSLARKAAEDKGYSWRIYKDVINDLMEKNELQLTDDQRTHLGELNSPPLNYIEDYLHSLDLVGR